jgi:ribosomal protein L17
LQPDQTQARDDDFGQGQGRAFRRGKNGHARQERHHSRPPLAVARLHQEDAAKILFKEIAPAFKERNGGYTRIIKMNQRNGDAAQRAILEWVE